MLAEPAAAEAHLIVAEAGDRARAALADLIDQQMHPLGLAAIAALEPRPGETVLDVGCGAGATVLQLAERVGPHGWVIGVDTAPQVLEAALRRTGHLPQVALMQEDASRLALADGSLDAAFSRFGMMFFNAPVAAFSNLHRMLKPGGRISFVCWRSMHENELDMLCIEAAGLPVSGDAAAYSLGAHGTVERILASAGFRRIEVVAHDAQITCGDVEATLSVVTQVGGLGKVLRENPSLLPDAMPRVRAALAARERAGCVHLGAATWIATAVA